DAAAEVDAAGRRVAEGHVAGVRAVDGGEELERMPGERALVEARLDGDRGRVAPEVAAEEAVEVHQAAAGEDALVAHVPELGGEPALQGGLDVGARREVGVAALARQRVPAAAVPDERGLAEARARGHDGAVAVRLGRAAVEGEEAIAPER